MTRLQGTEERATIGRLGMSSLDQPQSPTYVLLQINEVLLRTHEPMRMACMGKANEEHVNVK